MVMRMYVKLKNIAENFRLAIEEAQKAGELKGNMKFFPNGSCSYTCDLLQRYLHEQGIETFCFYGQASYGECVESHVWLETEDGIIIDITGDQYKSRIGKFYNSISVYVGSMTPFYRLFEQEGSITPYCEPDFDTFGKTQLQLNADYNYEIILKHMY